MKGEFEKRIELIIQETKGKGDPILLGIILSQVKHTIDDARKDFMDTIDFVFEEVTENEDGTQTIQVKGTKGLSLLKYRANAVLDKERVLDCFEKWFGDEK